jgi:hypothetical protein
VVEENGQRYYSLTVSTCGWKNLDYKVDSNKIEIQPSKQLTIKHIHFIGNQPTFNYDLFAKEENVEGTVRARSLEVNSLANLYCEIEYKGKVSKSILPLARLNGSREVREYPTINNKRVSWFKSLFRKTQKREYVHYKLTLANLAAAVEM